jgi:hypothetical protein
VLPDASANTVQPAAGSKPVRNRGVGLPASSASDSVAMRTVYSLQMPYIYRYDINVKSYMGHRAKYAYGFSYACKYKKLTPSPDSQQPQRWTIFSLSKWLSSVNCHLIGCYLYQYHVLGEPEINNTCEPKQIRCSHCCIVQPCMTCIVLCILPVQTYDAINTN